MNENLIAIAILMASVGLVMLGVDDGSLCKMIVGTYLGFLVGKRVEIKKKVNKNG